MCIRRDCFWSDDFSLVLATLAYGVGFYTVSSEGPAHDRPVCELPSGFEAAALAQTRHGVLLHTMLDGQGYHYDAARPPPAVRAAGGSGPCLSAAVAGMSEMRAAAVEAAVGAAGAPSRMAEQHRLDMTCGCTVECCGICVHAQAAGRTRENAVDWEPPDLNKLRGTGKREQRDGESGEPRMWYWQMTGMRWDLTGKSFAVETKAWRRLAATQEELSEETLARLERADKRRVQQKTAESTRTETVSVGEALLRARAAGQQEELQENPAAAKEERLRDWRALSDIVRRCGLNRLRAHASALHQSGARATNARKISSSSSLCPHPYLWQVRSHRCTSRPTTAACRCTRAQSIERNKMLGLPTWSRRS